MVGDCTCPAGLMTKETWTLPENSLCNRGGNFGGAVNVGVSPEEQAGGGSAEAHALSVLPKNRTTRLQIVLMAGLTMEFSRGRRGAKRRAGRRLQRLVRHHPHLTKIRGPDLPIAPGYRLLAPD